MRLLVAATTVVLVALFIFPTTDAGMENWFKGWGKGKGRGGRRRPTGQYRPIYIHAPPIVQHAPSPSLYKKPSGPSYGYGAPAKTVSGYGSGGFSSSFGKGFASTGLGSAHGKGFGGSGVATSYKAPAPASFKAPASQYGAPSSTFATLAPQLPVTYGAGAGLGHGVGAGLVHTNEIGHGAVGFGSGLTGKGFPQKQGFGPIKNDDLIVVQDSHASASAGYKDVHIQGMTAPKAGPVINGPHGNVHQGAVPYFDTHLGGAAKSKGHGVSSVPHHASISHSFTAPAPHQSHGAHAGAHQVGSSISFSAPQQGKGHGPVHHGDFSYPAQQTSVKTHQQVSLSPPPVYIPGSNSISNSATQHSFDNSGEATVVAGGLSLQTQYKTEQQVAAPHSVSAPLPMAEHGTSSLSYLEAPPAPLYTLENNQHSSSVHKSAGSFNPSKQIPFPGETVKEQIVQTVVPQPQLIHEAQLVHEPQIIHQQQVLSNDVDASYSAPAVGISSAPHTTLHTSSTSFGRQLHHGAAAPSQVASQAVVSFDSPLDYSDPIIEIVFEDAPQEYVAPAPAIDPSLYQPQSDDVEVYFIEVSDDETYETVDDLDLSSALAGVKEEFPDGLPPELSQTLLNSGFLDNAQIEVLDLQSALGDNTLDHSVRSALREAYGSESQNVATVVDPPTDQGVELRLKRLVKDRETIEGDVELAKDLSGRFRQGRYGGVVELDDKDSEKYLPVEVDGKLIPIPDHPELQGRKISGVLVYADESDDGQESAQANVVLSTSRRARQLALDGEVSLNDGDWKPIAKPVADSS